MNKLKERTLETLTVVKLEKRDTKKDGTKYLTKQGKPWNLVFLTTQEYGNKTLMGADFNGQANWNIGDKTQLIIFEDEYNGQVGLKFEFPKTEDRVGDRIGKLEGRVMKFELSIERIVKEQVATLRKELLFEKTGKFNTSEEYAELNKPHPMFNNVPEDIPMGAYDDSTPF